MPKRISEEGLKLIKNFEGCRLKAYKPVPTETYWTIGWGHYGPDVKPGSTITQAQADKMLVEDMVKYEAYVNNPSFVPVTDKLNQNQFDALVSFCYNCGAGNLRTLCKDRSIAQIALNITKYDKAGGKVLAGLTRRRKAEFTLYNTPVKEGIKVSDLKVKLNFEHATVDVNGKSIPAMLVDDETVVSVRDIVTALGGKVVSWDAKTKTVKVSK